MSEHSHLSPDPRDPRGPFAGLMAEIRQCKEARKCPGITSRRYYFEPNPITVAGWQESGLYLGDIDRRVVFVCESPGPQFGSVNDPTPSCCWSKTRQDDRFRRAREKYRFGNCYITNSVKCGVRTGGRHSDAEIAACGGFLAREIQLVAPVVAVAMGENAYRTLRQDILPLLDCPPVLFEVTHYSARGNIQSRWDREFAELDRLLNRLKPQEEW